MARGEQASNKTYFKIGYENNDKDNGKPFFGEQKKINDKWESVTKDTFLEGHLMAIKKSSYDYRGKPQYTFEMLINGGDENYALQMNYGFFTRSILNSLATIENFGATKIKMEIYRNKDGFISVAVKNTTNDPDGERTDWLMPHTDLPKTDDPRWLNSFAYFIDLIHKRLEDEVGVPTNDSESTNVFTEKLAETIDAPIEKSEAPAGGNDPVDKLPF